MDFLGKHSFFFWNVLLKHCSRGTKSIVFENLCYLTTNLSCFIFLNGKKVSQENSYEIKHVIVNLSGMVNLSQIKFFKPSSFFQGEVEERHYIKEKHKEPTGIRKVLLKTPFLRRIPFVRPGYKPGMVFVFW